MKPTYGKDFVMQLRLSHANTIKDAISTIDNGCVQIALVLDENERLIGTVTDGDIRRALLQGESIDTPVEKIMFRRYHALTTTATEKEVLALMRSQRLRQIPTIDEQSRVVGLFVLEELIKPKKHTNPVVIMAGGKGKRLHPLTQHSPKPMLRVQGKPLLEIILGHCIDAGFQHFYLSVNHLKNQIQDYFGDGSHWQVRIDYLEEEKPLGTGGALSLLPQKPKEPLLVINGDVLTRLDYRQLLRFHDEQKAAATLCVREHTTQLPYGVVSIDDLNVLKLEEKPLLSHYINAGIYLLNPALLELVPHDRFFDMPKLLEKAMQQQHRVSAFPIYEYWLDVGHPETLELAHGEWV